VGGPARAVRDVRTGPDLVEAVRAVDAAGEPLLLLGGGSNVLVADSGFDGTVVRIRTEGVDVQRRPGGVRLRVAAGQPWDDVVALAVASGWSGLEALSGIPGSTGATPIQNVGAYGSEVGELVASLDVLDRGTGELRGMAPGEVGFGYRTSTLKRAPGRFVVLSVTFDLAAEELSAPLRYAELAHALGASVGARVPLARVREAVLALRRGKGMVLDPADHDTWSAGSFFTNPLISIEQAAGLPPAAPRFAQPDGTVKTSAAWLISHAGFERGHVVRPGARASLSTKHSLALTNRGGATTADLLELARQVREGVARTFGITLQPEPVLVGCAL